MKLIPFKKNILVITQSKQKRIYRFEIAKDLVAEIPNISRYKISLRDLSQPYKILMRSHAQISVREMV
jgi:hypothetical protein